MELQIVGATPQRRIVRCAVICASCDLPAGRKLCGFLGHSARLGCSKCKKEFHGHAGFGARDFSGFDRENWVPRSNTEHRSNSESLLLCTSKSQLRKKESELGCRYSCLQKLPYYDAPRMLVVDPMHNLFLGLAKHFTKRVLIDKQLLTESDFEVIQQRTDKIVSPADIGRIPYKIQSFFSSFTADQFKNWVVHYSLIAMHGLLQNDDLECWRHLVLACRLLCQPSITQDRLTVADTLLLRFCQRCERQYGKDVVTPNMHMACHLCECIRDYGPLNHFWLFAFERFNGILGQFPTNNRSIEVQMMKQFLNDQQVMWLSLPDEYKQDFEEVFEFKTQKRGTLSSHHLSDLKTNETITDFSISSPTHRITLPSSYTQSLFNSDNTETLIKLYSELYSPSVEDLNGKLEIHSSFYKYMTLTINGQLFCSYKSRSKSSSIILAKLNEEIRPARINFFARHNAIIDGTSITHVLVSLSWFQRHRNNHCLGKPVTVWEYDLFCDPGIFSFLPVQFIISKTVSLIDKLDEHSGKVLFVSPYF